MSDWMHPALYAMTPVFGLFAVGLLVYGGIFLGFWAERRHRIWWWRREHKRRAREWARNNKDLLDSYRRSAGGNNQ